MNHPQPFGRYELLDRISAGGMAEVFRARDAERGGAIVALKKILPHIAEDEEFIQMFSDEARIASSLEHPHIARTLDFGRIGSSYYIAFEYVRGKDMRTVFERSVKLGETIPLPFLLYVFARIGEGLSYAHARKDAAGRPVSIVHRDVSPQNIVVSYSGDVKLIDFGIAKAAGKLSRTAVGAIKGKFGYMSPEQVRGLEIDQRTDVFSLGITMWELFTRQRLFAAENELLVLEKIRNLEVKAPSSIDPTLPPALDAIILRALAKSPDDRFQSAKELYRDMNILAQSGGLAATRNDVSAYMQKAFGDSAEPTGTFQTNPQTPAAPAPQEPPPESQSGPRATPSRPQNAGMSYNPENSMAGANDKRSDLDIFEGLGKKGGPARNSAPPAPPPSRAPGAPPTPPMSEVGKKTLMGIAAPAGIGGSPVAGRPIPPPSTPPRGALPAINAPPHKTNPPPPPPAVATKPAPYGLPQPASSSGGGGLDMDWDDDDEATHIFDKENEGPENASPGPAAGIRPAAGMAPPPNTSPLPLQGPPQPSNRPSQLAQTMGLPSGPPPPPPRASAAPPPPPSVGGSFARASGQVAGSGPLINQQALNQQAMTMPLGPGGPPSNQHTEPLRMPPRPPSAPPPQPPGGFAMTRPLQQNNPFLQSTNPQPMMPPPSMQQPSMQQPMQQYDMPVPQAPRAMEATALVRPPQSSKIGLIIGIVIALVAAVGVAAFFLIPRTGNIAVNVADAKGGSVGSLEIYLDGKKVCDTAPCRIDQVKAGSHELKVSAQGYDQPSPKLVAVQSGKDEQIDLTLTSSAAKGTGFKVTGTQPGVKLLVDGKEVGALPQELRDLEPGPHTLKFVGTLKSQKGEDRYAALDQSITVGKDEVKDLGSVTLKVVIGKATITLDTPDANVKLVASNGDQRTPKTFPVSIEIDTSKASWTIDATKFGMNEFKQLITFDDGQAEKVYTIHLDPKGTVVAAGGGGGGGAVVTHPSGGGGGGGGGGGTTAPTGGGSHLTINAIPVAGTIAILDGKPIGAVPKKDYAVTPGSHTIMFINSEKSLRKTITVTVGDGESKPAFTKLDE